MVRTILKKLVPCLLVIVLVVVETLSQCLPSVYATSTIYYVDSTAIGANDGASWENAYNDLQSALAAVISGDEIWVAAGTYYPGPSREATFHLISGVTVYGGFPVGGGELENRDLELNPTILSGDIGTPRNNSDNVFHVVTASETDETTIIDSIYIKYGNANSTTPNDRGGGMYNDTGSPTLNKIIFDSNNAMYGGGMHNYVGSNPLLKDVTFINNTATTTISGSALGGAIYNRSSNSKFEYVKFINNSATGRIARGGAVYIDKGSSIFVNVSFQNNTVEGLTSHANGNGGGGMYCFGGEVLILNVTVHGNTSIQNGTYSSGGGGGIYVIESDVTLMNTEFHNNHAFGEEVYGGRGGGLLNEAGNIKIINSTFTDNGAEAEGHAIYNNSPDFVVANSIIWGNEGAGYQIYDYYGSYTYSIIEGGEPGTGNINSDPKWIDPTNGDLHLQYSSPAIDAGNNTIVITDSIDLDNDGIYSEPIPYDLDGNERFFDMPVQPNVGSGTFPLIDIGTFEVFNIAPTLDNSGDAHFPDILEDETDNQGSGVSELIASGFGGDPISDPDTGALEGIAVIDVENSNGVWQYSTNGGSEWTDINAVSDSYALVLADGLDDRLRFIPNLNFSGTINPALSFRAWDCSDGFSSGTEDVYIFTTGGASPYSIEIETTSLVITPRMEYIYLPFVVMD